MTPLSILGIGLYLPPSVDVLEIARAHGGDTTDYRGWPRTVHALEGDQPSTMGARALRQALEASGVPPNDLKLVIFSGLSRDYLPSWSVSTEVMKLCGLSANCLGLDITAGCLATLAGLDLIQGWLAAHGGGCAAVVASERWTQTINFKDPKTVGLWQYGDSAGALLMGLNRSGPALADFLGAEFRSDADNNGHVLVEYGGTRAPQAPPGVNPFVRKVSDRPRERITGAYRRGYGDSCNALRQRFGVEPKRMVCNQMSPQVVGMLIEVLDMKGREVITGNRTGHLGGTDIIVGLQTLVDQGGITEPVVVGASTAYGFGTGLFVPHRA